MQSAFDTRTLPRSLTRDVAVYSAGMGVSTICLCCSLSIQLFVHLPIAAMVFTISDLVQCLVSICCVRSFALGLSGVGIIEFCVGEFD